MKFTENENRVGNAGLMALIVWAMMLYTFTASAQSDEWPELPLLEITTDGGIEPTATVVYPPEGCVGTSIISEHVPGRLVMTVNGKAVYDSGDYVKGESGVRIKIRGNSTGANLPQHPYKLKLSKKADLLDMDKKYKSKDWALLAVQTWNKAMKNADNNILHVSGLAVCRALEMPWSPQARFVNVVLNGKYIGLYCLTETVERADNRVVTDKTGFLIENDAYWWKEGEVWFKTDRQHQYMGYTFKYPDADDVTDEQKEAIKAYMNDVETAIFSGECADYIDYESFARWILAHDMLGSSDAAGCNMYMYKECIGTDEPSEEKLKMATLWDFDSCFLMEDTQWSRQHTHPVFYYPELFKNRAFVDKYKELYNKYKDSVYPYVESYLNDLNAQCGTAFEQSRELHRQVYDGQCPNTLHEQIDDVLAHLKARLDALDGMVEGLQGTETSIVGAFADDGAPRVVKRTDLSGRTFIGSSSDGMPAGVYVESYSDGSVKKVVRK